MNLLAMLNSPQSTNMYGDLGGGILQAGRFPGGSDIAMLKGAKQKKQKDYKRNIKIVPKPDVFEKEVSNTDDLDGTNSKPYEGAMTMVKIKATTFPSPVQVNPELEYKIPAERRKVIDRLVRATNLREAINKAAPINVSRNFKPLQIRQRQFNDHDFRINTPYGLMGLAMNATPAELKKMVEYCEIKKKKFIKLGLYDEARLFGNRQAMISGILTHLTTFGLV